ncbi:MAG TPA: FKBP-type peptidyl-prolyl cis-trans isomerase [Acidimicrobiales bacterium]|nr:FKBP-type peptidyl-prolyl cis-trans isomerase [Acidimicrobiales bacterium]
MNRNAGVGIGVVAVAVVAAIGISFVGSGSSDGSEEPAPQAECAPLGDIPEGGEGKPATVDLPADKTTGEVVTTVLEPGDGPEVTDASYVTVDYLGIACSTGEQFDSSWDRGEPITIAMPSVPPTDTAFSVIPGWNQGLVGQQQGALVQLDIPSELAYGAQGNPPDIAANDPLTFVVRIIEVSDTAPAS